MKLSNRQKKAIEILTGRRWDSFHPQALIPYFAKTDNGKDIPVMPEAKNDFDFLMECHHWHSVTVEMWKEDFRKGLLFLDDFNDEPEARKWHVLEMYKQAYSNL